MIQIKNLSKEFSDEFGFKKKLISDISAVCADRKLTTFLTQTGAGKSSLLKIISGIEIPGGGEIENSKQGKIAFLPPAPSSFPWLNVYENIQMVSGDQELIKRLIAFTGLEGYEKHIPHNKSLGFRFRISLARALAANPSALAVDEIFNNMETDSKKECYNLIRRVVKEFQIPVIIASTNITEAVFLSDKIYLLKKEPAEIISEIDITFEEPRNFSVIESKNFADYRDGIEMKFKTLGAQKLFNISI